MLQEHGAVAVAAAAKTVPPVATPIMGGALLKPLLKPPMLSVVSPAGTL